MNNTNNPFSNHVATYWQSSDALGILVERLVFKNPQSSNYYIEFMCYQSNLVVTGDLYEAIYAVNNPHVLSFWANCDADYLASKMRDLDGYARIGREHWSPERAEDFLRKYYKELREEGNEKRLEAWSIDDPLEKISSKEEWHMFLGTSEACEIFGNEYGEYGSIGYQIHPQVEKHCTALRAAVAQLRNRGVKLAEKK